MFAMFLSNTKNENMHPWSFLIRKIGACIHVPLNSDLISSIGNLKNKHLKLKYYTSS